MSGVFVKLSTDLRTGDTLAKLRGVPLSVFLALGLHIDGEGKCFPAVSTLAKLTGYSTRQVNRALGTLETLGLINRTPQFRDGRQIRNTYQMRRYFSYGRSDAQQNPDSSQAQRTDE